MAEPDNSNIGLITTASIAVVLVVVAIVAAVEGLYWHYNKTEESKKLVAPTYRQLAELREGQQLKLIKADVDKAMQETVKDLAAKQGGAGGK